MYVTTLVAKDCHNLATGPKSVVIANFRVLEPVRDRYGGFGGGGGGFGGSERGAD
jgi:hypothetical protein